MANQLILGRALDADGYIAPGAKATVYADGTSTLITVYSDEPGTLAAANPIVADANGFWPQRYVNEDAKVVVTDANDVALYTLDPAPTAQGTGAAASQISVTPSVPLPRTDVQSSLDYLAAQVISGFTTFGLGVTGNATLLANLDATGTASGVYRFDGTTTGTYPTGVVAGDTGAVELWRQAGATAMMELHHATSNRVFRRRLTSSTWGAWREVVNVNQATAQGDIPIRGASDFQRLAIGSTGQRLIVASGLPAWAGGEGGPTTASGTSVSFSSIPSTARKIIIFFNGVTLSGTDSVLIQIGTGGTAETTGYDSHAGRIDNNITGTATSSSGFFLQVNIAANALFGFTTLEKEPGSNTWHASAVVANQSIGLALHGGRKALAGVLDMFRVIPNGANTFDGGAISYRWEA